MKSTRHIISLYISKGNIHNFFHNRISKVYFYQSYFNKLLNFKFYSFLY